MGNNILLWKPDKVQIEKSNLTKFINFVSGEYSLSLADYNELYEWSVTEIEDFWEAIWKFSGIKHSKTYDKVLNKRVMPGAKWFQGARLNFAENLLKYKDDRIALISAREDQPIVRITYNELYRLTASCATGLKKLGVKKGDVVAGYVTNTPETIIAMLAATSIGALWTSCSPDFGLKGVYDRFGQVKPKILFAIESYQYNGKFVYCREKIDQIADKIKEIERIVLIPHFMDITAYNGNDITATKFLNINNLLNFNESEISFEQIPFDYPVYIMYSSGTTGLPKCMVHGAGGTLLQHYKEHVLHTNLMRDDVITYYTTCGWMMWNWLISSLQVGASIFLFDGSPGYPDLEILWKQIEDEKINVFGTSPKFLSTCQKADVIPKEKFDLSSLKVLLSTGSPLTDENFSWVYKNVKSDLQLSSISGGTDIVSCFMLGNPILPVYSGEIQCRGLGMKVEAFDENGYNVISDKGELVCTEPFPSMPVNFWNDDKDEKYHKAYFDKFNGVWTHGDYIRITNYGGIVVYGRSDATLNPGGVRIGTSEIYRIVESIEEVVDSIVVGKKLDGDIKVVLFVVLKEGIKFDEELVESIKATIRNNATPRHVPSQIHQVSEIPRTISGKKVEIAVTKIINGELIDNKDALANPGSLDQFIQYCN